MKKIQYDFIEQISFILEKEIQNKQKVCFFCEEYFLEQFYKLFSFFLNTHTVKYLNSACYEVNKQDILSVNELFNNIQDNSITILPINFQQLQKQFFFEKPFVIKQGKKFSDIIEYLQNSGYIENNLTTFAGQYSLNGNIVDIGVVDFGIRINCDKNENIIEIQKFNYISQLTFEKLEKFYVFSCEKKTTSQEIDLSVFNLIIHQNSENSYLSFE